LLIETSLDTLVAGEQVQLTVGDTLRVRVSFSYAAGQATTITLWATPYQYKAGILDHIEGSRGTAQVSLDAAVTPVTKEATVDMKVIPAAQGGISDGTYGLIVEIPNTDVSAKIDSCLVISGNPPGLGDILTSLLPMLVMVMMLGMIMPMMQGE